MAARLSATGAATGAASVAMLLLLAAADRPSILGQTSGGLWELSGGPGGSRQRQCIGDPALLAQIEHRRSNCTRVVVRDRSTSAEVHYTCAAGGFGRTSITMLTPRSLRIETQGISSGAPFHYVLQARRVGKCAVH